MNALTAERCEELAAQMDDRARETDALAEEYRQSAAKWRARAAELAS